MTDEIKHRLKVLAVPGVPLLVYAIGIYTACALHPTIPINTQRALFAPLTLLMACCWDVLIRLAVCRAQDKGENPRPYRVLRWGSWLTYGGLAVASILPQRHDLIGLAIAVSGCAVGFVGAVWSTPGCIRMWRTGRRAKAGNK